MILGVRVEKELHGVLASPGLLKKALSKAAKAGAQEYTTAVLDWISEGKSFRSRTGFLFGSISWRPLFGSSGAEVFVGADYGPYVEYGTRAHIIRPKKRKALFFDMGGRGVFSKKVFHPGTKPLPFFFVNMAKRTLLVERVFREVLAEVLELD